MTQPYITGKRVPLRATFVASILRNPDMSKVIRRAPVAPSGGDVYVFCIENGSNRQGWKYDNIHFHHDGTRRQPKNNPIVRKIFFCAMLGDGRWTRDFMKHVYTLYFNPNNFVLIHYIGNETIAREVPRHRKPRKSSKKQTSCSSTAVQVDTSELSPFEESSDDEDVDDVDHNDDDEIPHESSAEVDNLEMRDNSYHPESNGVVDASTSINMFFGSAPVSDYHAGEPDSLSYINMLPPMANPLSILSEVTLSCRPIEPVETCEASTSSSLSSLSRSSGAAPWPSTSREFDHSEQTLVIPKKRPAMRVEGSELSSVNSGTNNVTDGTTNTGTQQSQPLAQIPKKRRLDFGDGPASNVRSVCESLDESSEDLFEPAEESSTLQTRSVQTVGFNNTVQTPSLPAPERTSTPRNTPRDRLQNSFSSLFQNIREIETVLANSDILEPVRETCETGTDARETEESLNAFVCTLVSSGQLAHILTKVMQQVVNWKQKPRTLNVRTNPCLTLISQVNVVWRDDVDVARHILMQYVTSDSLAECDANNYHNLIAACVVGAYRTRVPISTFVTTLSSWPAHLDDSDQKSDIEVEESAACSVEGLSLTGAQLKTLEKSQPVDSQVVKAYLALLASKWGRCLREHCFILPSELQDLWRKGDYSRGMIEQVCLTKYTWLLMLCQCSNSHCVLLVANVKEKTIGVINTAKSSYPNIHLEIVDHWRKYMKARSCHTGQNMTRWQLKEIPIFEQAENMDSGIHVMMEAELILGGMPPILMRSCHVRRYRHYALATLLNWDGEEDIMEDGDRIEMMDDSAKRYLDVSYVSGICEHASSASTSISNHSQVTKSRAKAVSSCMAVPTSCKGKSPAKSSSSCWRKNTFSETPLEGQDKAIDFSRGSGESHGSSHSSAYPSLFSSSKEHDYAYRSDYESGFQSVSTSASPSFQRRANTTGASNISSQCDSFQKPRLPVQVNMSNQSSSMLCESRTNSVLNSVKQDSFQDVPCDMTMQSQLALDSQPSTSSQSTFLNDEFCINGADSHNISWAVEDNHVYNTSVSSGATFTELSRVLPSDLQADVPDPSHAKANEPSVNPLLQFSSADGPVGLVLTSFVNEPDFARSMATFVGSCVVEPNGAGPSEVEPSITVSTNIAQATERGSEEQVEENNL